MNCTQTTAERISTAVNRTDPQKRFELMVLRRASSASGRLVYISAIADHAKRQKWFTEFAKSMMQSHLECAIDIIANMVDNGELELSDCGKKIRSKVTNKT